MAGLTFGATETQVASVLRMDLAKATEKSLVGRWINDAIQDIHGRSDWFWAQDRAFVKTVVDKTAGTVSINANGVTAVTGVGTAFAATDVGSFIQFSSADNWYKINSFTSATSIAIESPGYAGTSNLSAGKYTLRKMFYTIANAEKILSIKEAITPRKIEPIHWRNFDQSLPFSDTTGKAMVYAPFGINSVGDLQFSLHPWADEVYNLEIRIKKRAAELSAPGSEPDIPAPWRRVIVDGAIAFGYEYVALGSAKEFDHQAIVLKRNLYEGGIQRMLAQAVPSLDHQPRLMNRDVPNIPMGPHLPWTLTIPQD